MSECPWKMPPDAPVYASDSRCWVRCEFPERPTDPYVLWHYEDCLGCRVAAEALARQFPDDTHVAWLNQMMAVSQ